MIEGKADLHSHTNSSDGTQPSPMNVRMAKDLGLAAIAITDHDTVAGVGPALEEGDRIGITVVPGVEISSFAGGQDIHVLGYYIDYTDETFLQRLKMLRDTRDLRNDLMLEKLRSLGVELTMEEVRACLDVSKLEDETIGRPHIAEAMIKKGYVTTMDEAFKRYLGKGAPAFVSPERIHPSEAVQWIHEAGGSAVLAHPGIYHDDKLVEELLQTSGFDGVEAYHSDHDAETEAKYVRMAEKYAMLVTAGSDFHGERNGYVHHDAMGSRSIDASILIELSRGQLKS